MAVVHQLELTADEAHSAMSTSDAIDEKTKKVIEMFKSQFGEVTPEKQKDFSIASRVMVYYSIADPYSLRGRLASVLPGDTVVIGGDAPPWYYALAMIQVMKFNPGAVLIQINPDQAVTVYSSVLGDIATHVADNKWLAREEPKPAEEKKEPTTDEEQQPLPLEASEEQQPDATE